MKTILTIAGSDPSGGAGLQADLRTFSRFGFSGLSVITAITAQDGTRVTKVEPVSAGMLTKQADALLDNARREFKPRAVKVGMLATAANVRAVGRVINKYRLKNVVLDPVLVSSSGTTLLEKKGVGELIKLLKLVTIVTPNTIEAGVLAGMGGMKVNSIKRMEEAARAIFIKGGVKGGPAMRGVVVTGGHLRGDAGTITDLLFDGKRVTLFKGKRLRAGKLALHGTGCVFSSALAASLAKGSTLRKATEEAQQFVREEIKRRQ